MRPQIIRKFLFVLLSILSITPAYSAEDHEENEYKNNIYEDRFDEEESRNEWYIVLVSSLLFSFMMSFSGAFIAYYSLLEDALFRKYKKEGTILYGDIVSIEYARRFGKQEENAEYITFVEYDYKIKEVYKVRIRKQMKAKASDFLDSITPQKEGLRIIDSLNLSRIFNREGAYIPEDSDRVTESISVHSDEKYLELLILPSYERSAIPRNEIEQACSWRYRMSTIALVLLLLFLAAFCTRFAVDDLLDTEDEHRMIGWYAVLLFSILFVLEMPLIYCFCHKSLVDALREQYIEYGEFIPSTGCETPSSIGSVNILSFTMSSSMLLGK